jgi:SAM-dependent methyltransferase
LSDSVWLQQCPRCRLGWWDWPAFDPVAFYNQSYFQSADAAKGYDDYAALETGLRRTAHARLRRITRLAGVSGGRRLLDIGCGTGAFLDEARRQGWDVRGVEVSAYAVEQARRRGLEVVHGPIEDFLPAAHAYDCVTLWDAIEHVRDPLGVLQAAGRALRPGGVLALSTGDVTSLCARLTGPRWHLFTLPEHLYFFSPAALNRLLARAGCRMTRIAREVNWLPVAYLFERLRKSFRSLGRLPVPNAIRAAILPATLFDVLGVYAVRDR